MDNNDELQTQLQNADFMMKLFDSAEVTPEHLGRVKTVITNSVDGYQQQKRNDKMNAILEQMRDYNITEDELFSFMTKPRKRTYAKRSASYVFAVVDGHEVKNQGALPKAVRALGFNSKDDVPELYWTKERFDKVKEDD
ncbi:hypothetical protein J4N45_14465 [Vibrio sp. SCSIO 43140]|uniref:hypothetical protein n=1 Tax=Vibrio sp. SCSIO 43140 TaxID=2819100 RepID=UPI0020765C27|nr:hypothetical protein [Vibrio sp. SCSIO 43140]USD58808.1 hypothetical protein J4N45_09720 [Vibrio sp. SCSIO 43140]USD59142.1 hypothetical protein J4N45_11425 [Vibrio sp. SCSIO 43140]USD59705.1 hypothetical protein J4N45_14465 [Vibrio sp. SCSIO 43140]